MNNNDFLNRRHTVIMFALLASTVLFSLFIVINLFMQQYQTAAIDAVSAMIALSTYMYVKKSLYITWALRIATLNVVIFFLIFSYISQAVHFSLIWTIFVPIFAIITNGKRVGLYFSLLFYALLFGLAYYNIGTWNNGEWLMTDWIRLVLASTILTACLYIYESLLDKAQQTLQKQSITDQLTGLYNRRYYDNMITQLFALAQRENYFLTFFILDIDYFKAYNDYYGHIEGDKALIKVAQVLKEHIQRGNDFVFRLGGEEFAGVVLSKDQQKTHTWISELTQKIRAIELEHKVSKISEHLTVSIGIATASKEQETPLSLYQKADKALYTAKSSGRNQNHIASDT